MKILEYYVYRKVVKFREQINEDDDSLPEAEAIKLFNDPFEEEHQYDIDAAAGTARSSNDSKSSKFKMITGSYDQDILKLAEDDMIDEVIQAAPPLINQRVKEVLNKHKDETAANKLIVKFQTYMMLMVDDD